MRVVIQRVSEASVVVNGGKPRRIGRGLVILLGVENADSEHDIAWLAPKVAGLRIFPDADGVLSQSVLEIGGEALVVSQFTLFASTRKGKRPSFHRAGKPDVALPLYEQFVSALAGELGKPVVTGEFGADMQVSLTNDGPVTIGIDSKARE